MPTHSLELPRDLHAKAKALAADRGITLERLLSTIVEDHASGPAPSPQTGISGPADKVRVRVGVTDATWYAASARARAERTTLTSVVLAEVADA